MDTAEFKSLLNPSKQKLFRIAYGMLKNRQDAEDVLQDIMLKLWRIRSTLSEYNSVEALAVTMTKNLCLDRLKSYKNRMQSDWDESLNNNQSSSGETDRKVIISEKLSIVEELIRKLPEDQQWVLQLRDMQQMEYEEIATITGINRGTIRVMVSRARKKIKDEYYRRYEHE